MKTVNKTMDRADLYVDEAQVIAKELNARSSRKDERGLWRD